MTNKNTPDTEAIGISLAAYRKQVYALGDRVNRTTRAAIKYMQLCGLTYQEIAKELDISEESAFALDHRMY